MEMEIHPQREAIRQVNFQFEAALTF